MTHYLELACRHLLEPNALSENELEKIINTLMIPGIDSADLYFQTTKHESWVLEDGIVKEASFNYDQGVGIRAISGDKTGFAYSDDLIFPALNEAALAARTIARQEKERCIQIPKQRILTSPLYSENDPLSSLTQNEKINLLRMLDQEARKQDPRVSQVVVSLSGVHEIILIMGSDGSYAADLRPLVRLNVSVIVEEKGRREHGSAGGGARADYKMFFQDNL
ncbi:MAG: tldD, partial [Francisellaceae bacterium]|nr:tldD [Francisellaceae bacterium]